MHSGLVPPAAVETHLEQVLESATFRSAERSRRLLRFIVEETLRGHADRLKDYTLGAEALGRGDGFDPRIDPIARVEASRLRARLDTYYATEGASTPIRIGLPKGGYVPRFEFRAAVSAERRARIPWPLWPALAIVVVTSGLAITAWRYAEPEPPEMRLEMATPPTTDPASLAIAPDGRSLVFVASADGVSSLWIRSLVGTITTPRQIEGTEYGSWPFWSPDGDAIGFFADGRIKSVHLRTGLVQVISTAAVPAGAAWNRDGVIVHPFVPDSRLLRTTVDGESLEPATELVPGQTGHSAPVFLPDGRHFLFYAAGSPAVRGVHVGELGSTAIRRLLDADAPAAFAPPGHLLYVKHAKLFARAFDPAHATLLGEPVVVADAIAVDEGEGRPAVSVSATGTIAYRTVSSGPRRQLIWFDRRGNELVRIGTPEARGPSYGSISPDQKRLAVQRSQSGNTNIFVVDLEHGTPTPFTTAPQADIAPIWSPKSDRIAYASQMDDVFELFEKPLGVSSESRLLQRTGQSKQITDWSLDERYLLYRTVTRTPNADMDIWAMPLDGDRTPFVVVRTPFEERDAQFSPDATWIAYQSNVSGRNEVYIQPFRRDGDRQRISTNGGVQVRWSADWRELFYLTLEGELMAVPITLHAGAASIEPGTPVSLFKTRVGAVQGIALPSYVVSPDRQRFLIDTVVEQQPEPISIILNWARPVG